MSRRRLLSKENVPPSSSAINAETVLASPLEPRSRIASVRDQWEQQNFDKRGLQVPRGKNSPTLTQLQSKSDNEHNRKSGYVYAAQRELLKKHHEAKSRVHGMSGIGGGVSLWPAMDDMRLSRREVNWLVVVCGILVVGTVSIFLACHGEYRKLWTSRHCL